MAAIAHAQPRTAAATSRGASPRRPADVHLPACRRAAVAVSALLVARRRVARQRRRVGVPAGADAGPRALAQHPAVFNSGDVNVNFWNALLNSAIVATTVTVAVVFFSALAGFAFAKIEFRGERVFMLTILATMLVPVQLG